MAVNAAEVWKARDEGEETARLRHLEIDVLRLTGRVDWIMVAVLVEGTAALVLAVLAIVLVLA